jgi:uncharacterized Ntn-hydrolase superfamily protein
VHGLRQGRVVEPAALAVAAYGWDDRNLVAGMFQESDRRGRDPVAAWPVWSWKGNEAQEEDLVADLRVTAAAHPHDVRLASLVEGMLQSNPRFARLWFNGTAGPCRRPQDH